MPPDAGFRVALYEERILPFGGAGSTVQTSAGGAVIVTLQVVFAVWLLESLTVMIAGYVPGPSVAFPEITTVVVVVELFKVRGSPLML